MRGVQLLYEHLRPERLRAGRNLWLANAIWGLSPHLSRPHDFQRKAESEIMDQFFADMMLGGTVGGVIIILGFVLGVLWAGRWN